MIKYLHQLDQWPLFIWNHEAILPILSNVRHKQGKLYGYMLHLGFDLRNETTLQTLTQDVLKSSEIEGEILNSDQVRSSIARRLGLDVVGLIPADRNVEGIVQLMIDATQNYNEPLDKDRLFGWHAALFPTGRSGINKIVIGNWRDNNKGPMQVVSGALGNEKVHYEAPHSDRLEYEMKLFLEWYNSDDKIDHILKSAISHLWFVTIHPFDDGNGRIARAIADMQLAKADASPHRFYSLSVQLQLERNHYYNILEKTQKGTLDITEWLLWFLKCMDNALNTTDEILQTVLLKTRFWDKHTKTPMNQRQGLLINKIIDGFTGKLSSSKWAAIAKCSPDTALRDINDLIEKDILVKETSGGRSTHYILKN